MNYLILTKTFLNKRESKRYEDNYLFTFIFFDKPNGN